jgi:hypothetical protein
VAAAKEGATYGVEFVDVSSERRNVLLECFDFYHAEPGFART